MANVFDAQHDHMRVIAQASQREAVSAQKIERTLYSTLPMAVPCAAHNPVQLFDSLQFGNGSQLWDGKHSA
ncbi:hypothetical protein [Bifidobacterium magnum]|uniref:hypothetical protein n=1 Tax=Bifidobacterium magnum TaxID=1692 RepID=UPI00126A3EF4|nr:hypothetical protein [Bifidobacterium magnum]